MIHLPSFALGVASTELARHAALPPLPPEAWIRLRPVDVVRPLPRRVRRRPQNWRNN